MGRDVSKKRIGGSSDNVDRAKAPSDHFKRDKATINRLQMYRSGKPVRDKDGRITGGDFMGKDRAGNATIDSSTGRVAPDRRWFGNTRVVSAPQLDRFREVMAAKSADPYAVVLHSKSVPMGLLVDTKVQRRAHLLSAESFKDTFGKGAQRKRPRIAAMDVGELLSAAEKADGDYVESGGKVIVGSGGGMAAETSGGAGGAGGDTSASVALSKLDKFCARDAILMKGTSRRIWAELYRVLDCSDVVVQVLDARDPQGTRSLAIEKHLRESAKHKNLIFVLNKVDLVPTWVTRRWVAALSREAPCLAFTAGNIKKPFGKGSLIALLRQLAKLHADKKAISVGFVGYPNVGKSSIINALKGSKACNVAPIPGETKVWQYVTLMKRVFLIDCPGTVHLEESKKGTGGTTGSGGALKSGNGAACSTGSAAAVAALDADGELVLKGVVRAEKLAAPEAYIDAILARVQPAHVTATYGLTKWTDANDFLTQVALKQGRLLPGGEPNMEMVAINVVNDWQRGKLPYYTPPPEMPAPMKKPTAEERTSSHAALFAAAAQAATASAGAGGDPLAGLSAKVHPLLVDDEMNEKVLAKAEKAEKAITARGKRPRAERAAPTIAAAVATVEGAGGDNGDGGGDDDAMPAARVSEKPAKRARAAAPNGGVSASVRARDRANAVLAATRAATYAAEDAAGDGFDELEY